MGALTPLTGAETPARLMGSGSTPALAVVADNSVPNTIISVPGANACVLEVTRVLAALDPVRRAFGRGSAASAFDTNKSYADMRGRGRTGVLRGKSAPNVQDRKSVV